MLGLAQLNLQAGIDDTAARVKLTFIIHHSIELSAIHARGDIRDGGIQAFNASRTVRGAKK